MSAIKSKSLTLQSKVFISKNNIPKALDLLVEAISINSYNFEALFEFANCQKKLGDYNQALDFYNQALKINSANPDLLYELSDCNFHLGNYDLCENKYKEILKFNPKYIKVFKKLAELYFAKKDFDNTEKYYKKYLDLKKDDLDSIIGLATLYLLNKEFEKAINIINTALKYLPDNINILNVLSDIYFEKNEFDNSLNILKKILKKEPNNLIALEKKADIYFKTEIYEQSIFFYKKYLEIKKQSEIYFKAYLCFIKLKEFDNAKSYINTAISLDLGNKEYWYELGTFNFLQEKYSEALNSFNKAEKTKETLYYISKIYLKLHDYNNALIFLLELYDIEKQQETILNIAKIYDHNKEFELSITFYNEYINISPDNIKILTRLGDLYYLIKKYDLSLEKYEFLLNLSYDENIEYKKAKCLLELRKYQDSLVIFEKFYDKKNNDLKFLIKLQKAYFFTDKYEKSIEINKIILSVDIEEHIRLKTLVNLGSLYIKTLQEEKAIETLNMVLEKDKNNFTAYFNLGILFLEKKEYKKAEEYFIQSDLLNPNDLDTLYNLSYCLLENGKDEISRTNFQKLIKDFPNSYLPYYGMGILYFKEKNYNKAILILTKTIDEKSPSIEVYLKLCEIYDYLDIENKSNELLQKAVEIFPNNIYLLNKVASIKMTSCRGKNNEYSEALVILEKLFEQDNKSQDVINNIILCNYKLENFNKASEMIDNLLILDNKNIKAMIYKGLIYCKEDNDLKAVEFIQDAISLSPRNKDCLMALAEVHEYKKRYEDAIWAYQRIIAFIPDDFISFKGISDCYFKLNNFPMAIKSYTIALDIDPTCYEMLLNMGVSYVEIGELQTAVKTFEEYIRKVPNNTKVYGIISNTYHKRDDLKNALQYIEKYLISEINPLPEYLLLAGKIYYDLDNIEKAMNFYKKSMEKNFYDSYIKLGNLFYELKDYDSSYNTFEKFLQAYPDSYDARILYSTLSYVKNLFGEREKHLYINIIDKTSEYLDPNYLFNVKKWSKDLILKIQEIIKIV